METEKMLFNSEYSINFSSQLEKEFFTALNNSEQEKFVFMKKVIDKMKADGDLSEDFSYNFSERDFYNA